MANLRISPINFFDTSDNLSATSEASGTALSYCQLTSRAKFWRSTSTASQTLQGKWNGGSRILSSLGIFRHNGHSGTVRLYLYSDAAWTTGVYDSTALNLQPSVSAGTYDWGHSPGGSTATDPLASETNFSHYFTPTTCASWKLVLGGTPPSSYWEIGRLFLGKYFEVGTNPSFGAQVGWVYDGEQSRTRGGSLRTSGTGSRHRSLSFNLDWISATDRPVWMDIMATCGIERDVMVSLYAALGGRSERDYLMNGKFVSQDLITTTGYAYHSKRCVIEEL